MTNFFSRLFGKLANYAFPAPIQNFINSTYVKIFHIDLKDFAPAKSYKTLNELFTRRITRSRDIDEGAFSLISPSDSLITECGRTKDYKALQIKGMSYCVSELLGIKSKPEKDKSAALTTSTMSEITPANELIFINFYLSPRDYHRFHAPCNMQILEARYFGGKLRPVNIKSLNKTPNLFIENERVVLKALDDFGGEFYFVAVGALNVGKMHFNFDPKISTNARANTNTISTYKDLHINKGEELGRFEMGSTVVIFAQNLQLRANLLSQKVCFGEKVASFVINS